MGSYLSCGQINVHYSYILLFIICNILNDSLYGFNVNGTFEEVKICNNELSNHDLIPFIFNYFGTIFCAFLLYKLELNGFSIKKIYKKEETLTTKLTTKSIELIHNERQNEYIYNDIFFTFIGVLILWNVEEQLLLIFRKFFKDLDFWMVELFIISYIYGKMFNFQIYKHQKLALILNLTFPLVLKIISIGISFGDKNSLYEGNLPILYANKPLALIGVIIYIPLIYLRSYVNSTLKWLMDLKYISSNKLLMLHGIMGTIFCSIFCLITSFIKCGTFNYYFETENDKILSNYIYNFNLSDYACSYKKNNTDNKSASEYYDKFEINSNINWVIEIIIFILGILSFFGYKYFYILIIKDLSPIHLILSFPIYYVLGKIVMIFNTLYIKKKVFSWDNYFKLIKFHLDISGDISSIIGFLIYLEIIILNFNEYNYNIKSNIIKRSFIDSTTKGKIYNINDDENEDEDL